MHLNSILPQLREGVAAARPLILIVEKDADLIASLTAQLKRFGLDMALLQAPAASLPADIFHFHDITLNRATCRVTRGGQDIVLGPTEFRLLNFLIQNPRHVYSRDQLLDAVWSEVHVEPRIVDVYIAKLRRGLAIPGQPDLIRTVRGSGYALDLA